MAVRLRWGWRGLAGWVAAGWCAAACGGGGGDGDSGGEADAAADVDGEAGGCPETGEPIDLVGTWAARAWVDGYMVTADDALVRLCPDRHFGVTVITLRVVVDRQEGGRVSHRFNVCRMDIPSAEAAVDPGCGATVRMALGIGPALARQLPTLDYPGGAELGGDRACSSYRADPLVGVFGTDGSIGADDPLPALREGCEDGPERCVEGWAAVQDTDGDGEIGVTLTVRSTPDPLIDGEAFTVFRTVDLLRGTVWDSTLIRGAVEPAMEYRLLDSDVTLSGREMPAWFVQANVPVFEIPREGSTFVLLRADGRYGAPDLDADGSGEVSCEEIVAAEGIFVPWQE